MQQLSIGTLLQGGKYRIERVLGQGGFGITYLAVQSLLDRKVCIKEFFYKEYCERDEETSHVTLGTQSNQELVERFLNKFLKEARTISQLEHANIIHIHDIFKENNTAYYVMDYIEGESLSDKVRKGGPLAESSSIDYIKQVASALGFVHKRSINHLDVKPANIMVRSSDNRAVLIDFGLSKQYDSQGGQTSTTPVGISHGYAPMEQYNSGGVSTFSPQTDIYSLGATLYKLVTGSTPPQASDVLNDGLPEIPAHLSPSVKEAITSAMQVRKKDRPADIESFLSLLNTEIKAPVSAEKLETSVSSDEETKIVQSSSEDVSPRIMPEKESAPVDSSSSCHQEEVEDEAEEGNSSKKYYWIAIIVLIIGCLIYAYSQCSSNGYYNNSPNGYYLETDSVSDTINSYQEEPADTSAKVISKEESSSNKKQEEKQPSNAGARESSTAEEVVEVSQEGNKITQREPDPVEQLQENPTKIRRTEFRNDDEVFVSVEQMPQFPGGDAALMKYLNNNINYPQVAMENGVQGRVIVQFVVTKNGTVGEVKVIRSVDSALDNEAVRLCKSLPKFIPGKMNDRAVNVWYTLPITFKLQGLDSVD